MPVHAYFRFERSIFSHSACNGEHEQALGTLERRIVSRAKRSVSRG